LSPSDKGPTVFGDHQAISGSAGLRNFVTPSGRPFEDSEAYGGDGKASGEKADNSGGGLDKRLSARQVTRACRWSGLPRARRNLSSTDAMKKNTASWLAISLIALSASAAWAEGGSEVDRADRIARLERQLEAQGQKLDVLRSLAASRDADPQVEQQRNAALKQQIREVLSEREFRESLLPSAVTAGYDDDMGFFLRSADDEFSMKIGGTMQFRFSHYGTRSDNRYTRPRLERDDRTGFDIARTRLMFTGNAYGKDLTYNLTMRADQTDTYDFRIHYAYVNQRFSDEFQVRAGIFRLASTRQQVQSDSNFQFIDRPMVDAVYGLGIGTGVRFWGQVFDKKLEYYVDVVNALTSPNQRTITPDPAEHDNNPAILAKVLWHVLADKPGKDFKLDGALEHPSSPVLDIGFHYAFNEDDGDLRSTRIPFPQPRNPRGLGGFGLARTHGLQIHQFGFESGFKYEGFSLSGEYIVRIVDVRQGGERPFAPWWLLTGDASTTAQHGAYVQAGYFLPIPGLEKKLELAARVGGISALANGREGSWEYAGCVNYYIKGNKVKLQAEVMKVYEAPISSTQTGLANVNDDVLLFRVQLQVLF
jgi:Phosphate-selective porin O and P